MLIPEKNIKNVAIVGSRSIDDYDFLKECISKVPDFECVISGGASGVDSMANDYAKENGKSIKIIYPKWRDENNIYDKGAGFKRNVRIVEESDLVLVLWDKISRGTMHDISISIAKRKPVIVFTSKNQEIKKNPENIIGFKGENEWLSNLWPCNIELPKFKFASVENAFWASKLSKDPKLVEIVARVPALDAKKTALKLCDENPEIVSPKSEETALKIMKFLVRKKFEDNTYLTQKLLATDGAYLEHYGKFVDDYWGVSTESKKNIAGKNMLGKILMEVREDLKEWIRKSTR